MASDAWIALSHDELHASTSAAQGDSASVTAVNVDVVIVGSGYGGAVIAKRLTERGVSVLMLEMGRLWNTPGPDGKTFCGIKNPHGRSPWLRNNISVLTSKLSPVTMSTAIAKEAGILGAIETPDTSVLCVRGVGGGSLVNMAMLVTPPQDVLHSVLPSVDAAQMMSTYYPRALRMLDANSVSQAFFDSTLWYEYARVGHAAARAAGFDAEFLPYRDDYSYMEMEAARSAPKSALHDHSGCGNNYCKQSLDKTYIADAIATGNLTIESLQTVEEIRQNPDGTYLVVANAIDVHGSLPQRKEVSCNRLFLCSGSTGTSQLLVRARDTDALPNLNDHVGTGWGPNRDSVLARSNTSASPTGSEVFLVPATGARAGDSIGKAVFSVDIPFSAGFETYISFNVAMTQNSESGIFKYNPVTDAAELNWLESQSAVAHATAPHDFDKIQKVTGSSSETGMLGRKQFADSETCHSVGGCPLGQATDDYGRVRGYQNLYVSDSSLIPCGIVSNPALTVAALTERNIERILREDFKI